MSNKHWEQNKDATIYVGNLDERFAEALMWELMMQMGPVINVHMPMDRVSRTHQGYGFVEFDTPESADYAARCLNGIRAFGKPIRVNKASADKQRAADIGAELFVSNLDPQVDEKVLYDTFAQFGTLVVPPNVVRDQNNVSKGYGFVSFDSFDASDAARDTMTGQYLLSKQITVEYAYKKDGKGERHGDEAERKLAAEGKKHNIVPEAQPLPPAYLMNGPAAAANDGGSSAAGTNGASGAGGGAGGGGGGAAASSSSNNNNNTTSTPAGADQTQQQQQQHPLSQHQQHQQHHHQPHHPHHHQQHHHHQQQVPTPITPQGPPIPAGFGAPPPMGGRGPPPPPGFNPVPMAAAAAGGVVGGPRSSSILPPAPSGLPPRPPPSHGGYNGPADFHPGGLGFRGMAPPPLGAPPAPQGFGAPPPPPPGFAGANGVPLGPPAGFMPPPGFAPPPGQAPPPGFGRR